jgi:hypothetical protein
MEWYGTAGWTLPACTECHASAFSPALDPAATNGEPPAGRHGKHVSSRGIGCERCHYQYPSRLTHMNGRLDVADASVSLVNFNITGPSGSWMNNAGPGTGQCSGVSCHGTDTLDWYGTGTWALPPSCTACHASSFSSVLDPTLTNGNGLAGKHGKHVSSIGFACTKCHFGYTNGVSHASGIMDTRDAAVRLVLFDSTNPPGAWVGDTGPETGSCSSLFCHGADTPEWYGLAGVTQAATCALCHGSPIGARRQVLGANGDFGANPNIVSHHVTAGALSDPGTDQCLVCHEMSQHMGGTVRLKNADTDAAIVYSAATPSSLEPFCLSCHDADGAAATFRTGGTPTAPFIDGSVLGQTPYPYALRIATSWTGTNGHGPNGNHATAKQLTCLGSGQPGTGCHGSGGSVNAHGSVNQVLAARNFKYDNSTAVYSAAEFDLCFTCHAAYPGFTKEDTLGVKQNGLLDSDYGWTAGGNGPNGWNPPYYTPGATTLFLDHNEAGGAYNDVPGWFGLSNVNLHWAHLGFPGSNFRGTIPVFPLNGINCVNCHNVHGSANPFGATYEELGYAHIFPDATNVIGRMTAGAYVTDQLEQYPSYCAWTCHTVQGPTKAWFHPIAE